MTDLRPTIIPKSDQLNADSLIGGPLTITVTRVTASDTPEQPIVIHFDGDGGKPYKPCKSMRRVLVQLWGPDGANYTGRRMALYRDDKVTFGSEAVGGIRISHLSHIERETTIALTASKAKRKPFTVRVLRDAAPSPQDRAGAASTDAGAQTPMTLTDRAQRLADALTKAPDQATRDRIWNAQAALRTDLDISLPVRLVEIERLVTPADTGADVSRPTDTGDFTDADFEGSGQ